MKLNVLKRKAELVVEEEVSSEEKNAKSAKMKSALELQD